MYVHMGGDGAHLQVAHQACCALFLQPYAPPGVTNGQFYGGYQQPGMQQRPYPFGTLLPPVSPLDWMHLSCHSKACSCGLRARLLSRGSPGSVGSRIARVLLPFNVVGVLPPARLLGFSGPSQPPCPSATCLPGARRACPSCRRLSSTSCRRRSSRSARSLRRTMGSSRSRPSAKWPRTSTIKRKRSRTRFVSQCFQAAAPGKKGKRGGGMLRRAPSRVRPRRTACDTGQRSHAVQCTCLVRSRAACVLALAVGSSSCTS